MQRMVGLFDSGMAFALWRRIARISCRRPRQDQNSSSQFLLLDFTRMVGIGKTRRNFMPWVALVFAILSLACNVALFVGSPQQAVLPWLSIFFAVVALFFLVIGLTRAFDRKTIYSGKTLGIVVSVFVLIIVSFIGFLSIRTRELPSAASAPQVGQRV